MTKNSKDLITALVIATILVLYGLVFALVNSQ